MGGRGKSSGRSSRSVATMIAPPTNFGDAGIPLEEFESIEVAEVESPCPDGAELAPLEVAIVADALALIEADPTKPPASDVRVYLRPGRKYTRVFWTGANNPEDLGSILYFVEQDSGQVYLPKSSTKVGRPMERVIDLCVAQDPSPTREAPKPPAVGHRPTPTRANHPNLALKGLVPGHRVSINGESYRVRSAAGGSPTRSMESGRGTGPDLYELTHERSGRIARLRVPGVVEQERDDASLFAGTIAATFGAKGSFGDERTLYSPQVERLPSVEAPSPAPSPPEAEAAPTSAEVWERDRVVWFRRVDLGESERRVELRRGDTAWVTLGKRDGKPRGMWASVNGISRARRELKMGGQWIDLPSVYSREEVKGLPIPAPPGEDGPVVGSPFASLLDGLRTRAIRKLRIVSTDATPHEMSVTRVVSTPGVVVAEGTIKRSKARLTIHSEVDSRGRPTKYARLRRGSRDYRVDARRITPARAAIEKPVEQAPAPEPPVEQAPVAPAPERLEEEVPTVAGASEKAVVGFPKGTELHRAELFSSWGGELALVDRPFDGGFDPDKMERTYTVRFAVDHQSKKPLNAVPRYVGVEPHILDRRVPYEQTGFTVGSYGERLEGTFSPLQRFGVRLKLRELNDPEHRELVQELARRGFLDATGFRFGKRKWQSLLGQSFTAIQAAEDAEAANEADRFVIRHFGNDSLSDEAVNCTWLEVARRGVYAATGHGRVKFVVHGREPEEVSVAAEETPAEAPSEALPERRETEHQRARRERAERKAAHLGRKAEEQWQSARAETEHIPMGQPILVGHHSERKHRKALERSHRKTRQAIDTIDAAESAKRTAEVAGYAISSDDPDAIPALEARLVELEASRELSKAINKAFRLGGWDAAEQVPGVTPKLLERSKRLLKAAPWLKSPMDLKNLGANIRRVRKRIEELGAAAERPAAPPIIGAGFEIEENPDDNRIRFTFDERPDRETITKMKRAGFRWSRRHGAWQRQLNNAGRYAAERMAKELFGWEPASEAPKDGSEEDKRAAEWQARTKAEHRETLERQKSLPPGPPRGAPGPESDEERRHRAKITAEDRSAYPADVIEEAEAIGMRPERVLELREMSRREEEDMGRRLRRAAREEEAAYRAERNET